MVLKRVKHGRPQLENLDAHVIPIEKYGRSNANFLQDIWTKDNLISQNILLSIFLEWINVGSSLPKRARK